ncbi:hypothetical protein ACR820_07430 [Streptomyces netropsis]
MTYNVGQGFTLVHEVQRTHHCFYLMARRAEPVTGLAEELQLGHQAFGFLSGRRQ